MVHIPYGVKYVPETVSNWYKKNCKFQLCQIQEDLNYTMHVNQTIKTHTNSLYIINDCSTDRAHDINLQTWCIYVLPCVKTSY